MPEIVIFDYFWSFLILFLDCFRSFLFGKPLKGLDDDFDINLTSSPSFFVMKETQLLNRQKEGD